MKKKNSEIYFLENPYEFMQQLILISTDGQFSEKKINNKLIIKINKNKKIRILNFVNSLLALAALYIY